MKVVLTQNVLKILKHHATFGKSLMIYYLEISLSISCLILLTPGVIFPILT